MEMTTAEKLAKVMELSVRINQETDFVTFVNFDGNVNVLELSIAKSGERSWHNENKLAEAEIPMRPWNRNSERQLDDLINGLQFIVAHHVIPANLPEYDMLHSSSLHGLCKTEILSSASQHNESTLVNTSTEAYLKNAQAAKEEVS